MTSRAPCSAARRLRRLAVLAALLGAVLGPTALPAAFGQAFNQDPDDQNAWHADLEAGSPVRVQVTPPDGQSGGYTIRVEAPDGSIVDTSPESVADPSIVMRFTAPLSGSYTVHVDLDPTAATNYALDMDVGDPGTPAIGPAVSAGTPPARPAPQAAGASPPGPATLSIVGLDPPPGTLVPQPVSINQDLTFSSHPVFQVHAQIAFDARAIGDAAQLFASYDLGPDGPPIDQIVPGPGDPAQGVHVGASSGTLPLDVQILPAGFGHYAAGVQKTRLRFRLCTDPTQPQGPNGSLTARCTTQITSDPYPLAPLRSALPANATPITTR